MSLDLILTLQWWGALFIIGIAAFPLTKKLFGSWYDKGYLFSKAVGLAIVSWVIYILGTIRVLPFDTFTIIISIAFLFAIGKMAHFRTERSDKKGSILGILIAEEMFFLLALLFWAWIKAHQPDIRGLEKFMDYGFIQSILNTQYFPPQDMWFAGAPINYYYFGHLVVATITKLVNGELSIGFNLMLASLFALTLTMSYSIGRQLVVSWLPAVRAGTKTTKGNKFLLLLGGAFTGFLMVLGGNLQTIYAFTKGYTGIGDVQPFWQLFWRSGEFWQRLPEGIEKYWYPSATRFIPNTISEFPSYSFVVSDIHGHILSLPFALLTISLLIHTVIAKQKVTIKMLIFYGFLVGVLFMTNTMDALIYMALLSLVLFVMNNKQGIAKWKQLILQVGTPGIIAAVVISPFLSHFKSFVTTLAINCPPLVLSNIKVGFLIFEGVEKCQRSPVWMWLLLWGFFLFSGGWWILSRFKFSRKIGLKHLLARFWKQFTSLERLMVVFFSFSILLVLFPEFYYFRDIHAGGFRANTMFKLGYQAFTLFSIVAVYSILRIMFDKATNIKRYTKAVFFLFLLPQLLLISIYPFFSIMTYFEGLRSHTGLNGVTWLAQEYPDDYLAIQWLKEKVRNTKSFPIIVEAVGESFSDYGRFSSITGTPTIMGWEAHEWLWRENYSLVAPRTEAVQQIYELESTETTKDLLIKYDVSYVIVGALEREKYPNLQKWKFSTLGDIVFQSGQTQVFEIRK